MGLPYRAKTIALFFLELGEKEKLDISPMKIQKLIYFAHGWCLAITGSLLIEESIEAWRYGPVISNIYYWLRKFGSQPVRFDELDIEPQDFSRLKTLRQKGETVQLLQKVWDVYKGYDAIELSTMTHLPESPWAETRDKVPEEKFNVTIDDQQIRQYFIEQFAKTQVSAV